MKFVILHCKFLNKDQFQAIPPLSMKLFNKVDIESLDSEQFSYFFPEQIQEIDPSAFSKLSAKHIPFLNEDQIEAFTPEQMRRFSPELISHLSTNTGSVSGCPPLVHFLTAQRIPHFNKDQVEALTGEQIKVLGKYADRRKALLKSDFLNPSQKKALKLGASKKDSECSIS